VEHDAGSVVRFDGDGELRDAAGLAYDGDGARRPFHGDLQQRVVVFAEREQLQ